MFPRGSLLLELLIVIAILGIILTVGTQAVFVSLKSGKVSGERDVAVGLASEALEAVRGSSEEKWQNIFSLTKASQHYKVATTSNKWTLVAGDEIVPLNNASYTRYVVIDNVSRDPATRMIETSYNSAHDDPSTQKITVTVSASSTDPVIISEYFLRWKNKACLQTSWAGGVGSGLKNCPDTTYVSSTNLGTPGTSLQVQ